MSVRNEVTEAVFQDVSKCFNKNIEDLSLDTRLIEDLGAKSVNFIQVASFLEEEFRFDDHLYGLEKAKHRRRHH